MNSADKRILTELQRNADQSLESLGERIGLSRNACWNRIKRLEDSGHIRGRVALLDPNKVNLGLMVFIAVRTNQHDPDWLDRFASATQTLPEIIGVFRTSGDLDYLIQARVPDVAAYDLLYQRLIKKVPLADVSASFVMQEIKQTTELPLTYALSSN
ncbi:MAG: Lrp/AsnC family transcriptional regulator [Pseudomonadota bacterium]